MMILIQSGRPTGRNDYFGQRMWREDTQERDRERRKRRRRRRNRQRRRIESVKRELGEIESERQRERERERERERGESGEKRVKGEERNRGVCARVCLCFNYDCKVLENICNIKRKFLKAHMTVFVILK